MKKHSMFVVAIVAFIFGGSSLAAAAETVQGYLLGYKNKTLTIRKKGSGGKVSVQTRPTSETSARVRRTFRCSRNARNCTSRLKTAKPRT
jgi:hypothetical protein